MDPLGLLLGAVVGLILALSGAGGGILAVPLLVFGMHLTVSEAAPVGLIAVGASSGLGAVLGLREGLVRYRAAALIGVVGMALAPGGVWLARRLPNPPLLIVFALVLALVAGRMLRQAGRAAGAAASLAPPGRRPRCQLDPADGRLSWTPACAWTMVCIGATSGVLSGLLGVGGGFVIVPALTRYTDIGARGILATSLAVIALVSTGAIVAAGWQGTIAWHIALPFASGAIVALLAGRLVAARLAGARLQQAFALVSAVVAALMLACGIGWIDR